MTILWPPFVGWMFFCSLLFRILSRTRVDIGYFRYISERKIWEVALANGTFIPLKRNTRAENLCAYDTAFVQIHQSYIINMNYLLMVQGCQCVMYPPFNNVDELQVSKKYRKEMMERFCQL